MVKVLHLVHTPRHSGAESLVRDLCIIHGRGGINCAVAAFAPPQPEFASDQQLLINAGTQLFFPQNFLNKMGRFSHFYEVYLKYKPDVVFAHSVLPSLYGRLAVPLIGKCKPTFFTVLHSASTDDFSGGYLHTLERLTRFRVDGIISVSQRGAENYIRRFDDNIPVSVIGNGINVGKFRGIDRESARAVLAISSDTKIVLQVGRMARVKRQKLSLEALHKSLVEQKIELWFAGLTEDEDYMASVIALAKEFGVEKKVKFLGSRSDIPGLLAAADVYVMPSAAEAHSIALLEALASGVPAVISDIPAFQSYRGWPGVEVVGTDDREALRQSTEKLLHGGRYQRDMAEYSLEATAAKYAAHLTIASEAH